jgi:hypothetical protein
MSENKIKITDEQVEVNGKIYVPQSEKQLSPNYLGDIKIVVLQRGWVYIGRFQRDGNNCKLSNAYCIRTWGTTKGLSELVNGATISTKLDKCDGVVEFDWLTTCFTISVKEEAWKII